MFLLLKLTGKGGLRCGRNDELALTNRKVKRP